MPRWTVHFLWAALLVSIVALSRAETKTSEGPKNGPQIPAQAKVAVVDIKFIITKSIRFEQQMSKLRTRVEEMEAMILKERYGLEQLQARLKEPSTSDDERAEITEKCAKLEASLKTETANQKQNFLREETAIYHDMIVAIDRTIVEFSKRHDLDLVLKFDGDPLDGANRESVQGAMTKSVCYVDPKLDITPWIMMEMRTESPKQESAGRTAVPRPR